MAGKGGIGEFLNGIASGDSFQASPGSILGGIQAATQQRRAKDVLSQLMGSQAPETVQTGATGAPMQPGMKYAQSITLPGMIGNAPVDQAGYDTGMKSLLTRLKPERALEAYEDKFFPKAPTKDDFIATDQGIYDIRAGNLKPGTGKREPGFKVGDTRPIQRGSMVVTQEYDGKQWNDLASGPKFAPNEGGASAGYRALTPQEIIDKQLDPAGSYQMATSGPNAGKVEVVNTPRQNTNPQKYKDQTASFDQLESTLNEYEKLLNEVGTEYWSSSKAARLSSLQTQMKFGIKGAEQTGALDRGSVEVMDGMIPDATGFAANIDPLGRGAMRAKAKTGEMKEYVKRARKALESGYNSGAAGGQSFRPGMGPSSPGAGGWSITKVTPNG